MKCPHCRLEVNETWEIIHFGIDSAGAWGLKKHYCPNKECRRLVLSLLEFQKPLAGQGVDQNKIVSDRFVLPRQSSRPPTPTEVPGDIAEEYSEACLVLADSPRASAALSRRCLQNLLRQKAGVKAGDLSNEIQQVLDSNSLPSYLSESIDGIRNIGNFGTHPIKSQSTGAIVPVETGEAEWNLDVLELLFDFYYVQPALRNAKRDALNKKLADAGKPPMKSGLTNGSSGESSPKKVGNLD